MTLKLILSLSLCVPLCGHRGQRRDSGLLLEQVSLEPGAQLVANKPSVILLSALSSPPQSGLCKHRQPQLSMWVLGIWVQSLVFVQHTLSNHFYSSQNLFLIEGQIHLDTKSPGNSQQVTGKHESATLFGRGGWEERRRKLPMEKTAKLQSFQLQIRSSNQKG